MPQPLHGPAVLTALSLAPMPDRATGPVQPPGRRASPRHRPPRPWQRRGPGPVVASVPVPTVGTPIPVGPTPGFVVIAPVTPDGRRLYVPNHESNPVTVIDTATMTVPTGDAPTSVAVLPDGRAAYVTNLHDGTLTVLNLAGQRVTSKGAAPEPGAAPSSAVRVVLTCG